MILLRLLQIYRNSGIMSIIFVDMHLEKCRGNELK